MLVLSRKQGQSLMATRVLIADPDRYLLATYKEHLSLEGFEVATAQDGLECLRRLREFGPDALVLEPEIPWGGGDGIVSMMHEDEDLPRVRTVVLLTHRCNPAVLYNIATFPISDYLAKPTTARHLAQRIRSALARSGAGPEETRAVGGGATHGS